MCLILNKKSRQMIELRMIVENNGLQQLWTLYKLASCPIKIAAGWAIRNCLASIEVC